MSVDIAMQERLRTFADPRFGYRRGADGEIEKELFDGTLPDGWFDSPARVDEGHSTPEPAQKPVHGSENAGNAEDDSEPQAGEPAPSAPADALAPPYDQYGFADLRDWWTRRTGRKVKVGTSFEELVIMHEDLDDEAAIS